MLQLKSKVTGKIIEVDEIDAHWYSGHEEYENVETPKTIETEQTKEEKTETVLKKRGRPRKVH